MMQPQEYGESSRTIALSLTIILVDETSKTKVLQLPSAINLNLGGGGAKKSMKVIKVNLSVSRQFHLNLI